MWKEQGYCGDPDMPEVGAHTAVRLIGVCEVPLDHGTALKDTQGHMGLLARFPGNIFTAENHWREKSATNWSGCCCSDCRNSMARRAQYGS